MDAKTNTKKATLTVEGKTVDFPVLAGTVGPDVIDISKLYAQTGNSKLLSSTVSLACFVFFASIVIVPGCDREKRDKLGGFRTEHGELAILPG